MAVTKWTPQVIAAEVARKKAANEDRNYGKVTATPAPKPATPSYNTPTPMPSTAKGSLVTQPFNPNTPVSTWGGASPINGGVNTPPKTGAPVPYSAPKVSTPPMLNSATNTGGTPPSIGYGGATYGQSGAGNQAIMANQNAIKGTAGFRDSEVTRSQGVIRDIESQLQNDPTNADLQSRLAGAKKYLGVNLGYQEPVNTPPVMQPQDSMSLSPGNIAQEADYQMGRDRADLVNATDRQTTTVKNNADYANKLLQDNRVLQDYQFNNTANPFSGRTSFEKGITGRQRAIDDTYMSSELTNQLNSISADLYNFDKLAPDRKRYLMNEMTRIEREFNLAEGALLGMYRTGGSGGGGGGGVGAASLGGGSSGNGLAGNGGSGQSFVRTLAGSQFDHSREMDISDRTGFLGGQRTLQGEVFDRSKFESDRAYDYQVGRDKVEDKRWQKEFDYRVKQDGIQSAISWYNAKTSRQSSNNASANTNFTKLMNVWSASGTAPAGLEGFGIKPGQLYKPDQDGNVGGVSKELMSEMDGLYTGLSSNQISPSQAKAEIDGRERMGLLTTQDATHMRSFIQKFSEGGGGGKPQVVDSKLLSMNGDQLLQAWETDPTGKKAGRAKYDWRSWVTDPRGYQGGLTYEMWHDQFGPRLGG